MNAPFASGWRFWAPRRIAGARSRRIRPASAKAVNGGMTSRSARSGRSASSSEIPSSRRRVSREGAVHLPVPGDQSRFLTDHAPFSVRAATPGRTFPSRNSSEAPPPVETWLTARLEPGLGDRRRRVASSDDRDRAPRRSPRPAPSPRPAFPAANAATSKIPIGPFQRTVPAPASDLRIGRHRGRTDVDADLPVGDAADVRRSIRDRCRRRSEAMRQSTGSRSDRPARRASVEQAPRHRDPVLLDQRGARADSLAPAGR